MLAIVRQRTSPLDDSLRRRQSAAFFMSVYVLDKPENRIEKWISGMDRLCVLAKIMV